jgi:peptidoglycan/LPS O-acetylase OafA/YrhL
VLLVLAVHNGVPFMQGAGIGVDGFFVLSGFLITCLLLQEWQEHGSISLRRFYIRRALRLLPALYALLAVLSLITLVVLDGEGAIATWRGIVLSFLYSTNLVSVFFNDYQIGVGLMSHSWSLALEEQFYIVWAGFAHRSAVATPDYKANVCVHRGAGCRCSTVAPLDPE